VHPESTIAEIESALKGTDPHSAEDSMAKLIGDVARRCGAEMVGVNPAAIAQTLKMAIG
jgi:hypothetical protein